MQSQHSQGNSPHNRSEPADTRRIGRPSVRPAGRKLIRSKRFILISVVGLLVIALLAGWHAMGGGTSLVPKKIQASVDFSVYYPANLPPGYKLDVQSFRLAEPGVVLFAVTYGNNQTIVFSEQQQPSSGDIDKFISSYLPLNSVLELPLGQAKIGAYGNAPDIRTLLSLPVHKGPWLIVTAPSEINRADLGKILQSLTK